MKSEITQSNKRRPCRGFTLVELLVVILIIATLGALSFAIIKPMRERAHESTSSGNMRQMGIALQTYLSDKNRYPSPGNIQSDEYQVAWDRILMPYLGDPDFDFKQGKSDPIRKDSKEHAAMGSAANIFFCPGDEVKPPSGQMRRSYAMCPWTVSQGGSGWSNGFSGTTPGHGPPPSRVSDPSRAVAIIEFQSRENKPQNLIGTANYDYLFGFRPIPQDSEPAEYHKNNQLLLFVDGHVSSCPGNITQTEWERKGYSPHKQ